MSDQIVQILTDAPVVAVLRGITPEEAGPVGDALTEAGVRALEVTLDSPGALESIGILARRHGEASLIAAGTVLKAADVARVADAGGRLIVAPNFSPGVVGAAVEAGLPACPGVMTPTEALAALAAGASMLKFFPGDLLSPKAVKSIRAVLPGPPPIMVTGGVNAANTPDYLEAGAVAVGIGSALYAPGKAPEAVRADAVRFLRAAGALA